MPDIVNGEPAAQRAAPAILDHVAECLDRGGFSDDAEIELFATRLEGFDDGDCAIVGVAFFVGGEQVGQRAGMLRVGADE